MDILGFPLKGLDRDDHWSQKLAGIQTSELADAVVVRHWTGIKDDDLREFAAELSKGWAVHGVTRASPSELVLRRRVLKSSASRSEVTGHGVLVLPPPDSERVDPDSPDGLLKSLLQEFGGMRDITSSGEGCFANRVQPPLYPVSSRDLGEWSNLVELYRTPTGDCLVVDASGKVGKMSIGSFKITHFADTLKLALQKWLSILAR